MTPEPATTAPVLARLAPELRRRAVLAYGDGRGALSNVTPLDLWGLRRQPPGEPLHLDVPAGAGIRSRPLRRLAAGFRSHLEIWGNDHVFTGPGMPAFQRQVHIRAGREALAILASRRPAG